MHSLLLFFALVAGISAYSITLPKQCELPLDMGISPCKGGKKEIRYHFDTKAFIPLAFEYTGCGGNENSFKSEGECRNFCLGIDFNSCAAGSKPFPKPETCQEDKDCGPKGKCTWGNGFKICCDKKITEKFEADWEPKCPKGKMAVKVKQGGIPLLVVGKTCKSKFCPAGATCVEGNYFASCCKYLTL
ncbi:hypothetical protein L5515_007367 [Caenorhabditis briggsae]|uniref:BPTI/Kunitz inhibitor domain-containing protein n=1 Tax=Caenorhabditis briggsae TaxID=6238 RepID=A0AAE9EY87_CAEBR|nr:hypothetical protein L5515_007367 [Caenorhabditis briggsae]